jgi:hypothetical protein
MRALACSNEFQPDRSGIVVQVTFWRASGRRAEIMGKLEKEIKKAANKGAKGGKGDIKNGLAGPENKVKDAAKRVLK